MKYLMLASLLIAAPVSAQSLKVPTLLYSGVAVAVWITTANHPPGLYDDPTYADGQRFHVVQESNPIGHLFQNNLPVMFAAGVAGDALTVLAMNRFVAPHHPRIATFALYGIAAVRIGFIAHNMKIDQSVGHRLK